MSRFYPLFFGPREQAMGSALQARDGFMYTHWADPSTRSPTPTPTPLTHTLTHSNTHAHTLNPNASRLNMEPTWEAGQPGEEWRVKGFVKGQCGTSRPLPLPSRWPAGETLPVDAGRDRG